MKKSHWSKKFVESYVSTNVYAFAKFSKDSRAAPEIKECVERMVQNKGMCCLRVGKDCDRQALTVLSEQTLERADDL